MEFIEKYSNGNIKTEGYITFPDSLKIGKWKHYYKNGELEKEYILPSGEAKLYYENGNFNITGNFENREKHGAWVKYYRDNKIKGIQKYNNGTLESEEKYYENGGLKFKSLHPNGLYKEFHEDGKIHSKGNLKNNEREGLWKFYDYDGEIKQTIEYKNGLKHGVTNNLLYNTKETFDKNKLIKEEHFYNNKKHHYIKEHKNSSIYFKFYHINGNIKLKGVLNQYEEYVGVIKEYNEDGVLKTETNYKDGLREGLKITYFENGTISFQQEYKNNIQKGQFISYYPNGKIESEGMANNQNIYDVKYYDENGNLTRTYK